MTSAARLATLLFVVFVLLALPHPALAAPPIVVGNGTPGSCTETALKDAFIIAETLGGGTIRFACGPAPVTIALSQITTFPDGLSVLLVLPNNTTIDGGGLVTLDGTRTATVAFVARDSTVVLTRLSIINGDGKAGGGVVGPAFAGGIENLGTLTVDRSTLSGNSTIVQGAGIQNFGTLNVRKSSFSDNSGGGISSSGTLTVDDSTFSENSAVVAAGIGNGGQATINKSTFSGNHADFGGAISNGGNLTVDHSTFSGNFALVSGGGIANVGGLTVTHSTITQNSSGSVGGGIFNIVGTFLGSLTLTHTSVTENTPDDIFP
jgi:hypothetical protein